MLVNRVIARRDTPSAIIWRAWTRFSLGSAGELGLHVLLLQRLDRIPVELQLLGNVLDRRLPTALAHVMGKALRIERVVRQEIEPLALHLAATAASHPPDLNLQKDARVAARQIANLPYTPVVPTRMNSPAAPANRFFARRASVMMRAFGSPKTPRTVGWGRKPGNMYVSHRRQTSKTQYPCGFKPHFPLDSSTRFPDEPIMSTSATAPPTSSCCLRRSKAGAM